MHPSRAIAAKNSFVPAAINFELMVLPSIEDLLQTVREVLEY